MSKSYEPQIKWRSNEVDELVASMKERDLLALSDGKKRRSLEVFKVVRSDLVKKGIFRTEEQIRKKMNELRKQYFEANRSGPENRYELCEHYDALHDLFTDAQRKLDKRKECSRAGHTSKRRHSSQNGCQDVAHTVQVKLSKSNRGRSVSGSSVCSSGTSVHPNGGEQNPPSQQNGGGGGEATVPNGGRRSNPSPATAPPALPDKFHLKQCTYQPKLNNSLTNLCKNDRYADVMLLVCNENDSIVIPAHRLVLGTFSPYFANVFEKFTFAASTPIVYVALPPNVTRAAMQSLLQYMYTGEAIVHSKILDDVMTCGEFLRINGFSTKKSSSLLNNRQGLVSVPLVTVTKTINMDGSVRNEARYEESATPAPTTSTTRVSAPPTPVPMTMQPYYDSQSPPRKIARHYEPPLQQPHQQQPLYQQPMQMQPLQHSVQQTMYQEDLLEQQLMQQQVQQRSQLMPQRAAQYAHQQQLQPYQQQHLSEDLYQPLQPQLRQQQRYMMQPHLQQQPALLQQRYHAQQLQPLDLDMEQDQLSAPMLQIPRQQRQQMMPTQQLQDMYQHQPLPLTRQQLIQTQQRQVRLNQQNLGLLQQPQRQMTQTSLFLPQQQQQQQQRQQIQSQQLQEDDDDLQVPEQMLESQQLLEPLQQPLARQQRQQPSTSQQQSQQLMRTKTPQQQKEILQQSNDLLESQQQREPHQTPQLQEPQDDLMQPQELLDSTQELLTPQQRMAPQRRPSVQQKIQNELIKPQETLDESQELLAPQKSPPQQEQPIQRPKQQEQPKQPLRQFEQQKIQTTTESNVVIARPAKDVIALPKPNDPASGKVGSNVAATAAPTTNSAPEKESETTPGNDSMESNQHEKSLNDSAQTRSDSEIEFLDKPRKNSIFEEFPDHRKLKQIEDHEQRKKDIIKEYEEQLKKPSKVASATAAAPKHPLVETPESSPSVAPVSPKSPLVAHRYASKSPLPATVRTTLRHRKPCAQRQPSPPSPGPDIIDTLDSMVVLTSDESMMEIIAKSPESQTSRFSTRSHSPDSQAKIDALIEHMSMPDTDAAIFVNSSMEEESCDDLDDDSNDHQEGTPLDQLVSSRLNCQLCYESFTTPPEWVQHVSGHCVADMGLLKRRRISNDGDSDVFRCDMCSSYFISAQDWQNHVANHEDHDDV
ncbi:transcriptional-regulating factor 1-like [Anopheles maculipalpis]|uniref:transcriptional-regulating factor 1-like n=1 Tax=Anopheles maculipalpis TaxID=1496333 RepID=UPI0021591A51|nr:transcriptional-regulating factor 1-like [Anopheles maculipalpis]